MRSTLLLALVILAPVPARAQLSPFQAAKAEALLRTKLPCLGCHALDGTGGRVGPDLSGVGARRSAAYIRGMVVDPAATVPGTIMPRVPLDSATRALIVAYLGGRTRPVGGGGAAAAAATPPPPRAPPRAPPVGGAPRPAVALYGAYCAPCHGETGRGDGYNARYLPVPPAVHADARAMGTRSDDMLFDAIAAGGYTLGRSVRMPPFGETLRPAEIRSLVGYIRRLCGCRGPTWSRPVSAGRGGRGDGEGRP